MSVIRAIVTVEDCLDSTAVREVHLLESLTESHMRAMATDAKLKFYPHFPRPYFRIERSRQYVIQGVIGNDSFRVTFLPNRRESAMEELWAQLGGTPAPADSACEPDAFAPEQSRSDRERPSSSQG